LLAFTFPCGGGFARRSRIRASTPALETEIGWPGRVAPGDLWTSATVKGFGRAPRSLPMGMAAGTAR
jgi:hypothetical protein